MGRGGDEGMLIKAFKAFKSLVVVVVVGGLQVKIQSHPKLTSMVY